MVIIVATVFAPISIGKWIITIGKSPILKCCSCLQDGNNQNVVLRYFFTTHRIPTLRFALFLPIFTWFVTNSTRIQIKPTGGRTWPWGRSHQRRNDA